MFADPWETSSARSWIRRRPPATTAPGSCDGAAAGRPFRWIHHVVTDPGGHRAAVTCMLEPALADRFGAADRELVAGLMVPPVPPVRSADAGGGGPR